MKKIITGILLLVLAIMCYGFVSSVPQLVEGFWKAMGMLFISYFVFAIYRIAHTQAKEGETVTSRMKLFLRICKWLAITAVVALVISGMVGGNCDSTEECLVPGPLTETWIYFFTLLLVPSMIGFIHGTTIDINKTKV